MIGRGAETWPAEATTGLLRFGYTRVTPGFLDLVFLAALIPGIKGSQRRVSARLVQRFLDSGSPRPDVWRGRRFFRLAQEAIFLRNPAVGGLMRRARAILGEKVRFRVLSHAGTYKFLMRVRGQPRRGAPRRGEAAATPAEELHVVNAIRCSGGDASGVFASFSEAAAGIIRALAESRGDHAAPREEGFSGAARSIDGETFFFALASLRCVAPDPSLRVL